MHDPHPTPPPADRRSFLKWATHGLGALFGLVLGIPAIAYLLDARNRKAPASSFKNVAKLSELERGVPRQVVIRDERRDAWTLHPNDVIGRVWLIRRDGDTIEAFTTICPHLGCSINFEDKGKRFICPCHGGTWHEDGKKDEKTTTTNPAPRDMDSLECRIEPEDKSLPDDQRFVLVEYKNFYPGKEEKVAKK
jgi:menaquinol-cytochrome c reductase iron-sulfur subunit